MAWLVLVLSGLFETVWAVALAESKGMSRPVPVLIFIFGILASMVGLAFALRQLPLGTGYVVWVGVGAVGTALYGMVFLSEPTTAARLLCLLLIVAGVVGLKLFH